MMKFAGYTHGTIGWFSSVAEAYKGGKQKLVRQPGAADGVRTEFGLQLPQ